MSFGYFFARKKSRKVRRIVLVISASIPVIGGIYLLGCIIIMAVLGLATGCDAGFGDGFDLPLRNHYHWTAIDNTTSADVYGLDDKRATDGAQSFIHIDDDNREAFANVLQFQEDGDWIAGAYSARDGRFNNPPVVLPPDHWFLFNTRTHRRFDADSDPALKIEAKRQGVEIHLESSPIFYSTHRFTWIDFAVVGLLLLLPATGLSLGLLWMRKLFRNDRPI